MTDSIDPKQKPHLSRKGLQWGKAGTTRAPKGSHHKLSEAFTAALQADFKEHERPRRKHRRGEWLCNGGSLFEMS